MKREEEGVGSDVQQQAPQRVVRDAAGMIEELADRACHKIRHQTYSFLMDYGLKPEGDPLGRVIRTSFGMTGMDPQLVYVQMQDIEGFRGHPTKLRPDFVMWGGTKLEPLPNHYYFQAAGTADDYLCLKCFDTYTVPKIDKKKVTFEKCSCVDAPYVPTFDSKFAMRRKKVKNG